MLPTIGIEAGLVSTPLPLDASKFGGRPLVPEGASWPMDPSGRHLPFVGQINFSEVASQTPSFSDSLPREGLLQLFYDMDGAPYGPEEREFWRFVWHPTLRVPDVVAANEGTILSGIERRISFHETYSVPDPWTLSPDGLLQDRFSDEEADAYWELDESAFLPKHQLLGHPWAIQHDPRIYAQFQSDGLYFGVTADYDDPETERRVARLKEEASRWRLLWQIDSDRDLDEGFMWGDAGRVYVMIERERLQAGDLSSPWLVFQCY